MKKYTLPIIGLLAMLLAPLSGKTLAADYPSKGVDYLHRGVANIENEPEFVFLWRANILGTYDEFSGPIAVGNKVWSANKGDNLFRCLELKTGALIWSYQLNTGTDGTPLWFENRVYVGTGAPGSGSSASLYCFNADNGDNLWRFDGWNSNLGASTPWVNTDNNYVYWVDGRYLRCLRCDNGELLWSADVGAGDHPYTGVYYDGKTYCPGLIKAYDAENGDLLWSISGTVWDSGITVDNDNVDNVVLYVGNAFPANVWCINPDNGDNYWVRQISANAGASVLTLLTVWENKIYGGGCSENYSIFCLRKDNGDYVWGDIDGQPNTSVATSPAILPSGKIIYANDVGYLKVRDANNGDLLWQYEIGKSVCGHVVVVDNYVLIYSDTGYLWCFGAGNVSPNKPSSLLVTGLTTNTPHFSAVFTDNDLGDFTQDAKVRIGTTDGGSDIWLSDWVSINVAENNQRSDNVTSIELARGTKTYYAQMKFRDNAGNESSWSDSVAFELPWFPIATNLLAEGQVSPQQLTTFTPNFSFHYTDNVDANSSMVHIQVGTSASDNSMWDSQQVENVENGATISITYAGAALQRDIQYFWRARVRDNENAWSDWSDNENFKLSPSSTVTVGSSTIELTLLEAGDAPVISAYTFTMSLTIGTSLDNLLVYYARTDGTPQIPADGVAPFYFNISTTNPDAISSATITFDIPKSWVVANDIIPSTLLVWRHNDGVWRALPSRLVDEDSLYYYLEATTSGFSLFGVSGQKTVATTTELQTGAPTSQTLPDDQQIQQVLFITALGILTFSVMFFVSSFKRRK